MNAARSSRSTHLLAAAIFLGVIVWFLGEALLPGRVLLPTDIIAGRWPPWQRPGPAVEINNYMLADAINYIYPVKVLAAQQLRQGLFPLWNPDTLGGYPLTYNTQVGIFYPAMLLYLLLPPAAAVDWTIIGQLLLGGFFMYLYLGRLGLRRPAALWGALLFAFNGHMMTWLEWQVVHAAIIWLPLQLWFVERLRAGLAGRRPLARETAGLALAFALPWLGGHWNWAIYTSMTAGVYALFRLQPAGFRPLSRRGLWLGAAGLGLGGLLALVQVWPAFNYLSQTHRKPLPYAELVALHGLGSRAAAWLVPHFYGATQAGNYWIVDVALSNDIEAAVYIGILPLLLGLPLFWLRRDWPARFFSLWGLLGLLWTLGTPAYRLLYLLPVFNALFPGRAAIIPVFSLTILSALGVDRLLDPAAGEKKSGTLWVGLVTAALLAVLAGYTFYFRGQVGEQWSYLRPEFIRFGLLLAAAAAILWLRVRGKIGPALFVAAAIVLLLIDLRLFAAGFNTIGRTTEIYPLTETERFLQAEQAVEPYRLVTTGSETAFFPNTSQVAGLENLSGYEPGILSRMLNYLQLAEQGDVIRTTRFAMPRQGIDSPLLDAANVKYIVTIADRWEANPVADDAQPVAEQAQPLPARWPILMSEAGLQRVDLWLIPAVDGASPAGAAVRLRVLSSDETYEFANARFPLEEIEGAGWVSFFFSPFPSEWGRAFILAADLVDAEGAPLAIDGEPALGGDGREPAFTAFLLPRPRLVNEDGKTRVYLNEGYFPRAYAVPEAVIVADEAEALAALERLQDELDRVVVLESEGHPLPAAGLAGEPIDRKRVIVERMTFNQVDISVDLSQDGFVILADTYYPGWRATIDGEKTPVYRANSIFRGVAVPAGRHQISFVFRPPDFFLGGAISAAALLICLAGLFLPARWRERPGR